MRTFSEIKDAIIHLFFPHICSGCGSDILEEDSELCFRCLEELPHTGFEKQTDNQVYRKFIGRLPLERAMSLFYFTKHTLVQTLIHQVKYKQNRDLGIQLGQFMGRALHHSHQYEIDALIPLPLHKEKEFKRGYNQAALLCEGMASEMHIPIYSDIVKRNEATETQTKKSRIERWQNVEGKFMITQPELLINKHVLLVDDVVTTGATLEACGQEMLQIPDLKLSIATLCFA